MWMLDSIIYKYLNHRESSNVQQQLYSMDISYICITVFYHWT